jgi:RNA polymerase sigma-70 factor (ECF subfamily)
MSDSNGRDPLSVNPVRSRKVARNLAGIVQDRSRWVAIAARLLGDREAADDVLQVAYLRALTRSSTVRDPERFASWFRRVLSNAAVDHARRIEAYERALQRFAVEMSTLEHEGERIQRECECVYLALSDVRSTYARIIRKVDLDGCTLEEVARIEGITPTNVRVRLHRARRALRSRLTEICGGSPRERCTTHCACDLESPCRPPVPSDCNESIAQV